MTAPGITGAYPGVGAVISRADFDALVDTLATWINDRGQRLVELDERATGAPDERTDVALAFVLWQAIAERRDAIVAVDWRDHGNPSGHVAPLVWQPLSDRTDAPLAANLPEAVTLVDELVRRVATALDHSDTSNVARHEARMAIEADLVAAERLAEELGDQVRAAADLRRELTRLTTTQVGPDPTAGSPDLDDEALARLRGAAGSLRSDLETTERERRAALAACLTATSELDRLRELELQARAAVALCADRFVDPPRLAVPSVDAVEVPPADLAAKPWPQARPIAETFVRTVERLDRALHHVIEVNSAPRRERDDLRGLLQAYRDKADSFGAAEQADVDAAYRAARDVLWSAPCDLAQARQLTAAYQRLVQTALGSTSTDRSTDRPTDETESP